jgi:uncharacterized protein with HEPN domain
MIKLRLMDEIKINDDKTSSAVIRKLEIIGEAIKILRKT